MIGLSFYKILLFNPTAKTALQSKRQKTICQSKGFFFLALSAQTEGKQSAHSAKCVLEPRGVARCELRFLVACFELNNSVSMQG